MRKYAKNNDTRFPPSTAEILWSHRPFGATSNCSFSSATLLPPTLRLISTCCLEGEFYFVISRLRKLPRPASPNRLRLFLAFLLFFLPSCLTSFLSFSLIDLSRVLRVFRFYPKMSIARFRFTSISRFLIFKSHP